MTRTCRMDFKKPKPQKHTGSLWSEIRQSSEFTQPGTEKKQLKTLKPLKREKPSDFIESSQKYSPEYIEEKRAKKLKSQKTTKTSQEEGNQSLNSKLVKTETASDVLESSDILQSRDAPQKRFKKSNSRVIKNTSQGVLEKSDRSQPGHGPKSMKKRCFLCRGKGHKVTNCPTRKDESTGILCYNCGSVEHSLRKCPHPAQQDGALPFATCFICEETGHVAFKCPKNSNGVYPHGGGCYKCGSNQHRANDCHELFKKGRKEQGEFVLDVKSENPEMVSADAQDSDQSDESERKQTLESVVKKRKTMPKFVKFK